MGAGPWEGGQGLRPSTPRCPLCCSSLFRPLAPGREKRRPVRQHGFPARRGVPAAACYTRPSVKAAQQQLLGGSRTSRAGHAPPVGSCWCRQDQARGRTGYPISLALYQVLPVPASFFGAPACARVPPAPAFLLPCLPAASCPHSSALSARLFTSLFLAQTAVAFHAFCSTLTSHHPTFPHFSFSSGFSQFRCPLPTAPI